jgi:hypothetical protein
LIKLVPWSFCKLLTPSLRKEAITHSWANPPDPTYGGPLLRVWDSRNSGSHPDESNRMLARLPCLQLRSRESRKESLATHADHTIRVPTPFISFSESVFNLQRFLSRRKGPSYTGTLTIINPNTRIAHGLPMIKMQSELRYYGIQNPYGRLHLLKL